MANYCTLNVYALFLAACYVSVARADEPAKLPTHANAAFWYESGLDMSQPLEALAGELVRERGLTPQELQNKKRLIVAKGKQLFDQKMKPVLLKQHDAKTAVELDHALQAHSLTLDTLRDQFVWKVLIGELRRQRD